MNKSQKTLLESTLCRTFSNPKSLHRQGQDVWMEALQARASHQQNSLQPSTALYGKHEEQFLLLGLPKVLLKLGWGLLRGLSTHHVLPLFYEAISLLFTVFLSLSSASVALSPYLKGQHMLAGTSAD